MIQSESDFIPLQVIWVMGQEFDAILGISNDGQSLLALRPELHPEAAETVQAEAAQMVKEVAPTLMDNEFTGKVWSNGKWSDRAIDLIGDFDQDSLHCEVVIIVTDHHR